MKTEVKKMVAAALTAAVAVLGAGEAAASVFEVNSKEYASFADALEAAKDGDIIKQLDNYEITEADGALTKNITLNLSGWTLTIPYTCFTTFCVGAENDVTIQGGLVDLGDTTDGNGFGIYGTLNIACNVSRTGGSGPVFNIVGGCVNILKDANITGKADIFRSKSLVVANEEVQTWNTVTVADGAKITMTGKTHPMFYNWKTVTDLSVTISGGLFEMTNAEAKGFFGDDGKSGEGKDETWAVTISEDARFNSDRLERNTVAGKIAENGYGLVEAEDNLYKYGKLTYDLTLPAELPEGIEKVTVTVDDVEVKPAEGTTYAIENGKTAVVTFTPTEGYTVEPTSVSYDKATTIESCESVIKVEKTPELAVSNVKAEQRWPWEGKVRFSFDLTGAGTVQAAVQLMTNDVKVCAATTLTGETTFDLGEGVTTNVTLVWNAPSDLAAAGLSDFNSPDAEIKVTAKQVKPEPNYVQLWKDGPYWAKCNVGAAEPQEAGYYFWWGDTVGYTNNGSAWISVKDGTTSVQFSSTDTTANQTSGRDNLTLYSNGWIDSSDSTGKLKPEHDAATAHIGSSWRMPTLAELTALTNNTTVTWTDDWDGTGVKGVIVTGNTTGYTDKSIFLPATGSGTKTVLSAGDNGYYWSSTPDSERSDYAGVLMSLSSTKKFYPNTGSRPIGHTIRAVRDTTE